ncbi:hypothetical protein Tco_0493070 [Tanacetum coccineum]
MGTVRFGMIILRCKSTDMRFMFQGNLTICHVIQLILWIVDCGCSKHMTGNLQLLRNFLEKFIGTVHFGMIISLQSLDMEIMFKAISRRFTISAFKTDLDNLFGPLYKEYYAKSSPELSDNSATNTLDNENTSSSSSIIVKEDEAP